MLAIETHEGPFTTFDDTYTYFLLTHWSANLIRMAAERELNIALGKIENNHDQHVLVDMNRYRVAPQHQEKRLGSHGSMMSAKQMWMQVHSGSNTNKGADNQRINQWRLIRWIMKHNSYSSSRPGVDASQVSPRQLRVWKDAPEMAQH